MGFLSKQGKENSGVETLSQMPQNGFFFLPLCTFLTRLPKLAHGHSQASQRWFPVAVALSISALQDLPYSSPPKGGEEYQGVNLSFWLSKGGLLC